MGKAKVNSELVQIVGIPRLVRKRVAEVYVGGAKNLAELEGMGLVGPAKATGGWIYYDVRDLDAAVDAARLRSWAPVDQAVRSMSESSGESAA